jgi:hypothetical protein
MNTAATVVHIEAVPASTRVPRGSRVAAELFVAASRLLSALWREAHRAPSSRAQEAAEVRRMADEWRNIDPSFAADLYAAAARHESLDDEAPARR